MTVMINSPPISGIFDIIPSTGFEFDTKYKMFTSQWYDDDLPLQYSFGFQTPSGSLTLFSRNQMSTSIARLPAGQDSLDFELSCQMRVFDSYDAFSSLNKTVTVKKHQLSNSDYKEMGKRSYHISRFYLFYHLSPLFFQFFTVLLHYSIICSLTYILLLLPCCLSYFSSASVKSAATESGDAETLLQIVLAAATALNSVTCLGASSVSYVS